MLVKITNHCLAGCSHCMENSTRAGQHMSEEVFRKTLKFVQRVESPLASIGLLPSILFSGGECTDHPQFVQFVSEARDRGFLVAVLSHGLWLNDDERRSEILGQPWPEVVFQITHDPRFYPHDHPRRVDDKRVAYIPQISSIFTIGRSKGKPSLAGSTARSAPTSYNFRSMVRALGSFKAAVVQLRIRAAVGKSGHCTPSVSSDGSVVAGESRFCHAVGTVESSEEELTLATSSMRCNACGLVDNLTDAQKAAIGEL